MTTGERQHITVVNWHKDKGGRDTPGCCCCTLRLPVWSGPCALPERQKQRAWSVVLPWTVTSLCPTVWRNLAWIVVIIVMVATKVAESRTAEKVTESQATFLSRLGQYEIATLVRVGPQGETLDTEDMGAVNPSQRRRRRRSAEDQQQDPSQLYYQLSTPKSNFLLNLTLQEGLLSRQFRVEYWRRGRLAWSHPYSPQCLYVGHLQSQPHSSKVALSNCNGLQGVIIAGGEEYLIEPLTAAQNLTRAETGESRPHVIYKRSSLRHQYMDQSCGVLDEKPEKGMSWWQRTLKTPPNPISRGMLPLKRSVSRERHVETLVVADKMMVGYHGRRDIEQYILAVMNIVRLPNCSRILAWGTQLTSW
ncbi:hypothetical protein DPEC_G00267420 [Dallia pectoralis]|uniref:Uncharacterized protein n=1 Tax=Dallia pectoralis TaxID=75939 RepID=A0ACC2FNL0_DALPE|nr:hypothetical protein DPEC_G00267420 [Dallia pectoralis]